MPRTSGTKTAGGARGFSKPKYGQRVNPSEVDPGMGVMWDLFNLLLDPAGTVMGTGGGVTERAKTPTSLTSMTGPDQEMAVENASQIGDMANQVAQWDPFNGTTPIIGETPPMPQQMRPPMPMRGGMPPAQPTAPPPLPTRPAVNDREMALANAGVGQYGTGPYAQPMGSAETDQLAKFFQMLARGM